MTTTKQGFIVVATHELMAVITACTGLVKFLARPKGVGQEIQLLTKNLLTNDNCLGMKRPLSLRLQAFIN